MDIIMPVFDGVSATACIRMVAHRVPIIAMTSNIRQEDINIYFQWGKRGLLSLQQIGESVSMLTAHQA